MKKRNSQSGSHAFRGIILLLLLCLGGEGFSQDIHFSQFFEAPLLRNPSLSGIFTGDIRLQAVYRDQWSSVTTGYRTGSLNGEYKLPIGSNDDFLTVGGQVVYDRAGTVALQNTSILPAINYHKALSTDKNRYLSLGFMGGLVMRSFDRSKMTTNSDFDGLGPNEPNIAPNYSYLDGSVGMSYNAPLSDDPDDNFFIGLAYHHLNTPKNSFYRDPTVELQPKWVGSAGFRFGVTEFSYLTLQGDYSVQGAYNELIAGALYGVKIGPEVDEPLYTIHGGALIRWNDAIIPVIKLDYNPFSVAFSYDVNISRLKPASLGRGGFEISIVYRKFLDRENSSVNAVQCPRF